jgi:uncharacterized membrane protein
MDNKSGISSHIRKIAISALFAAIIFLMTFTPVGFINLGIINATIVHVPVIIGSIILGPRAGACLGGLFGLASLLKNSATPVLLSFAFTPFVPVPGTDRGSPWALFICFVPRILVGVVPYYADKLLFRAGGKTARWRFASLFCAGILGSITNTILVMYSMYFIFRDAFAQARNVASEAVYGMILAIITGNGIPEAIVAGVLAASVCKALEAYNWAK